MVAQLKLLKLGHGCPDYIPQKTIECDYLSMASTWFNWHYPDNKVHGASMGPIWGQQDPCGPHVGPMNFAVWVGLIDNNGLPPWLAVKYDQA